MSFHPAKKEGILVLPRSGYPETPVPLPKVCTDGQTDRGTSFAR